MKYGRLTLIKEIVESHNQPSQRHWLCQCDCGNKTSSQLCDLKRQKRGTRSCGCLRIERIKLKNTTHGRSESVEYNVWSKVKARCSQPNRKDWYRYGGRGIKVCERWSSFKNFFADMGPRPSPKHSIDRINNNGNYEPSNCRWATLREQCNNRRSNRILKIAGEKITLKNASRKYNICHDVLQKRLNAGWSTEDSISIPIQKRKPKCFI